MTGVIRWALCHKRLVVGFWLVLTILGMAFSKKATDALSQEYSVPGYQSYQTNTLITSEYGGGGDSAPLAAVATLPAGASAASPAATAALRGVTGRIGQAVPGSRASMAMAVLTGVAPACYAFNLYDVARLGLPFGTAAEPMTRIEQTLAAVREHYTPTDPAVHHDAARGVQAPRPPILMAATGATAGPAPTGTTSYAR